MKFLTPALLTLYLLASPQNSGTLDPEVQSCASGTSILTTQQCAFLLQAANAIRQVNELIASGEYAKLPKRTQETMAALVDTVRTALPLMKDKK